MSETYQLVVEELPFRLFVEDEDDELELVVEENNVLLLAVAEQGAQGPPGTNAIVFNETPTGLINGSNATFTTEFDFIPESVQVFLNGVKQKIIGDYNTSGTQTIILVDSPLTGELVTVSYQKA